MMTPITSISALCVATTLFMHFSTKFQGQISPATSIHIHHGYPWFTCVLLASQRHKAKLPKALRGEDSESTTSEKHEGAI